MLKSPVLPTLPAAVALALVYLLVGGVKALHVVPRSRWLSLAGGGVVLNVLKEELPEERESRFGAFALGLAGYAALLLAL